MALTCAVEEIESRFDDLRAAQYLVKVYRQGPDAELDEEMKRFIEEMENVCQTFTAAIFKLDVSVDESQFSECYMAYENALNGIDAEGKFTHFWRKFLTNKVRPRVNAQIDCILFFNISQALPVCKDWEMF